MGHQHTSHQERNRNGSNDYLDKLVPVLAASHGARQRVYSQIGGCRGGRSPDICNNCKDLNQHIDTKKEELCPAKDSKHWMI